MYRDILIRKWWQSMAIMLTLFALAILSSLFFLERTSEANTSNRSILGEKKTLVMLFNYIDDQSQGEGTGYLTVDYVKTVAYSADNWLREISYDKAWLNTDFIDWRTLPRSLSDYKKPGVEAFEYLKDAMELVDDEVYFPDYQTLVFIFLNGGGKNLFWNEGTGFGSYPLPYTDDGPYTYDPDFVLQDPSKWYHTDVVLLDHRAMTAMKHELGHSLFGVAHASAFEGEDGSKIPPSLTYLRNSATYAYYEYGDQDDEMGGGQGEHVSADFKNKAGWFELSQVVTATQSAEYVLDQFELPSEGVKMLEIPLGKDVADKEAYYFLEYRKQLGTFKGYPLDIDDAVQVRMRNKHYTKDFYRETWKANTVRFVKDKVTGELTQYLDVDTDQPFIDPYRGIKIEMLEKTGEDVDSKARIKVTYSGVDITSKNQPRYDNLIKMDDFVSGSNPRTLTLTNNTENPLVIGQSSVKGRDLSAYKIIDDNISNKTIPVGGKATLKVHFVPTSSSYKLAYLSIPTDNETRPKATVSLHGYDSSPPGLPGREWYDLVTLSLPAIFPTISLKTNSFNITWKTEDFTPIKYQLQYRPHTTTSWSTKKIDGQTWTNKTKTTYTGKEGYTYYFRIRAKDSAGNTSAWTDSGKNFTIIPYDDRNTKIKYSKGWKSYTPNSSFKKTLKYTDKEKAFATIWYRQNKKESGVVALIAPTGPKKGKVGVYVRNKVNGVWTDWEDATTYPIDLYSSSGKARKYFTIDPGSVGNTWDGTSWTNTYDKTDIHQIKFVATGTKNKNSGGYRINIDGIAIQRGIY